MKNRNLNKSISRGNNSFFQNQIINRNENLLKQLYAPQDNNKNLGQGEPMDLQNTMYFAKARMSNFGTKMAELDYKLPSRDYQDFVKSYLTVHKGASKDQLNREFLFQTQKMLSDDKIQQMIQKLEQEIFYVPSGQFRQIFGNDWKQKIVRAVAMKEPILYRQIKSVDGRQNDLFPEVNYIHQNVWPWGSYLVDLNKFQKYYEDKFVQKSGLATDKTFLLPFYDLEFRIKDKVITVKYKNVEIGPFQLSTIHMRAMAIENIKSRIQGLIESFAKYTKKKFEENQDLQ